MFDDSVAYRCRKKIDNGAMNFRRRSKGPALSIARNNFGYLIGELLMNAAVGLCCQLRSFGDGPRAVMGARAVGHRESASQIADLIQQASVRVGDIERLDQLQTWPPRWGLVHPIN